MATFRGLLFYALAAASLLVVVSSEHTSARLRSVASGDTSVLDKSALATTGDELYRCSRGVPSGSDSGSLHGRCAQLSLSLSAVVLYQPPLAQ